MLKLCVSKLTASRFAKRSVPLRHFSTASTPTEEDDKRRPNMVQQMEKYQIALQHAIDQKYDESLNCLHDCVKEVDGQVGPNTNFHLFLYQKIASLQIMDRDILSVENTFKKCIDVAEKAEVPLNPTLD